MLLLAKIENDRFPEKSEVDLGNMIEDALSLHDEIYSHKDISSSVSGSGSPVAAMNEQMASVLVGNLVKNAYVHSSPGSTVEVSLSQDSFSISNSGTEPLDRNRLFRRFYQPGGRKEGSSGLGLALVYSVCERSGFAVSYDFKENRHIFVVNLKNSK